MEEETKKKESVANAEFEKNNADFCSEFLSDVEKRNKAVAKKRDSADALRLRGNAAYKRREYKRALDTYAEALRALPYATKTLLNVAQCMVKLGEMEDALEYLARVLYLDERNSKVLDAPASHMSNVLNGRMHRRGIVKHSCSRSCIVLKKLIHAARGPSISTPLMRTSVRYTWTSRALFAASARREISPHYAVRRKIRYALRSRLS